MAINNYNYSQHFEKVDVLETIVEDKASINASFYGFADSYFSQENGIMKQSAEL